MKKRKKHKETLIQVNTWVDEGVAPLVTALNLFPQIETLDSCEGYDTEPYVYFRCRSESETITFATRLNLALRAHLGSTDSYLLRVEWVGTGEPLIQIVTSKNYLNTLQAALAAILQCFTVTRNTQGLTVR